MHDAQALVAKDKEPITPFIAKVRPLVDRGVSCILVIGGSGDYFDVADVVRFCAFLFAFSFLLCYSLNGRLFSNITHSWPGKIDMNLHP